jgi:hypothetical protein
MMKEGFARLAFEAHYDADHPAGGGWDAWSAMVPDGIERAKWLAVGELVTELVAKGVRDAARTDESEDRLPDDAPARYALVEQMGHRSTVAAVRETTFLGEPVLEVTGLLDGRVHLVSPKSLYELTWLTETEARQQVKPWTAVALTTGPDPWATDDERDEQRSAETPDGDDFAGDL